MKLIIENWNNYLDEVEAPGTAEIADQAKKLGSLILKMKGPIIKMIAKGFKSPINATKMAAYYAKSENMNSLVNYFATALYDQGAFGGQEPNEDQIIQYINKNSSALIQMGVMHYNKETGSDIKLENETLT